MSKSVRDQNEPPDTGGRELAHWARRIRKDRTIALIGLMGAGKTTIGRRLAAVLRMPFVDADVEIERAAGLTIPEIFARHGEEEFRRGERNVIARLLDGPPHILATGGGAYMDEGTRAKLRERAITLWLRAPVDVLLRRIGGKDGRPLLKQADPESVLRRLLAEREPTYATADITVETGHGPHGAALMAVLRALAAENQETSTT